MESFMLVLELIGTMAFSAAGTMTGLRKNMDIFGVCILGLSTAVGGGVIRDLILGCTPPATFRDPIYVTVSLLTSLVLFLPQLRHLLMRDHARFDLVLFWMDAVGLGIFTAVGIRAAFAQMAHPTLSLLVFVAWSPAPAAASSGTFWPATRPISSSSTSTPAPPWPGPWSACCCGILPAARRPCWPGPARWC